MNWFTDNRLSGGRARPRHRKSSGSALSFAIDHVWTAPGRVAALGAAICLACLRSTAGHDALRSGPGQKRAFDDVASATRLPSSTVGHLGALDISLRLPDSLIKSEIGKSS